MNGNAKPKLGEIEKRIKAQKALLKAKFKVKEIGIFGSYLRGKQKKSSDLDLLVEFSVPVSLFDFVSLENYLSQILGVKVDLVMKDSLKARIRDKIIGEALYV